MDLNDKFAVRELLFEVLVKLYEKDERVNKLYKEKWEMESKIKELEAENDK